MSAGRKPQADFYGLVDLYADAAMPCVEGPPASAENKAVPMKKQKQQAERRRLNTWLRRGVPWLKLCDECGKTAELRIRRCRRCGSRRLVTLYRTVDHRPDCFALAGHTCDCRGRVFYQGSRRN